tara:strand:- start:1264 stop:1782 length:519 start_codon:yes stop_codon:yes gene_type:complete
MQIRPADAGDHAGIDALLRAAFATSAEARLVQALRAADADTLELVAEDHDAIIGAVLFTPVEAIGADTRHVVGIGLAPLAVTDARRQQGIGSALVETGLDFLKALGPPVIAVLGEPDFYARFGFVPASRTGWRWDADHEDSVGDAFQLLTLDASRLPPSPGKIRYHRAFSQL